MPRSAAQKRAKRSERVRNAKMATPSGPPVYAGLSAKDLNQLIEDYEEHKRLATARVLEGISLDPRENRRRFQLPPPPAPGKDWSEPLTK